MISSFSEPTSAAMRRQAETVAEKQDAALENARIRQNQNVRRLEINFRLRVRHIFDLQNHPVARDAPVDFLQQSAPIIFRALRPARDDEPEICPISQRFQTPRLKIPALCRLQCCQKTKAFFRARSSRSFSRLQNRHVGIWHGVVDAEWNHAHFFCGNFKTGNKFALHFFRVDKNMVAQPVLKFQRRAVQPRIVRVAFRRH